MAHDPQKVIAALADGTRYGIYQHVLALRAPVGVPQVAQRFGLHPNVARMHLNKLVQAGLLIAQVERTGKGGRPSYLYESTGAAVSVAVPAQDAARLADLLVESLSMLGDVGKQAVAAAGKVLGNKLSSQAGEQRENLPEAVVSALRLMGIEAHAEAGGNVVLRNCGFQEAAADHPELICHLCQAIVEGVVDTGASNPPNVKLASSLPEGATTCTYQLETRRHSE